jgi:MFS family permease
MSRRALAAVLVAAALLRALPLFVPALGVELELAYPRNAVRAVVERDWREFSPVHGALLSDVLRAATTIAFGVGRLTGRYGERVDLLADFVRAPWPFVVAGRALMLLASLVAVVLAARMAARLGGPCAGPAAAVILATSAVHVRQSLQVWPDGLAATMAIATVAAALAHVARGTLRSALWLGALSGLALSSKPALAPLAVSVALALWWGGSAASLRTRAAWAAAAAAAALASFLATMPYAVLDWSLFSTLMRVQAAGSFASGDAATRIPFATLATLMLGMGPLLLAAVGVAVGTRRATRQAVVVAAFPLAYGCMLARANPYARYFVLAAPFVAVLGGVGAAAIAEALSPRRAWLGTAALVAVACAVPAYRSWEHVRLLARDDTRVLAGAWLEAHVAPGTGVTLPNIVGYANPVVAPDAFVLRVEYAKWRDALRARGLGDPARTFRLRFQGILSTYDGAFAPRDPIVVTASHPAPSLALRTPAVNEERLRAAGYTIAARFDGAPDPPPPGLVYDPQDADYAPLAGGALVPHPGPTLTIYASRDFVPARAGTRE